MSKKRWLYMGIPLLAVLIIAGLVWVHFNNKDSSIANSKKTQASENAPNNARKESSSPQSTLNTGGSSTGSANKSSAPQTTPTAFRVQIVNANVNGNNLHIGDIVNGTSNGSCNLTASKSGQTIQLATSTVKLDVNNYDCGVFNIPTSKFTSSGSWTITLTVTNNGSSASGNAIINI